MAAVMICPRHKTSIKENFGVWEDDNANNHTKCVQGEPLTREDRQNWLELPRN